MARCPVPGRPWFPPVPCCPLVVMHRKRFNVLASVYIEIGDTLFCQFFYRQQAIRQRNNYLLAPAGGGRGAGGRIRQRCSLLQQKSGRYQRSAPGCVSASASGRTGGTTSSVLSRSRQIPTSSW